MPARRPCPPLRAGFQLAAAHAPARAAPPRPARPRPRRPRRLLRLPRLPRLGRRPGRRLGGGRPALAAGRRALRGPGRRWWAPAPCSCMRPVLPAVRPFRAGALCLVAALALGLAAGTLGIGPGGERPEFWDPEWARTRGGMAGEALYWVTLDASSAASARTSSRCSCSSPRVLLLTGASVAGVVKATSDSTARVLRESTHDRPPPRLRRSWRCWRRTRARSRWPSRSRSPSSSPTRSSGPAPSASRTSTAARHRRGRG